MPAIWSRVANGQNRRRVTQRTGTWVWTWRRVLHHFQPFEIMTFRNFLLEPDSSSPDNVSTEVGFQHLGKGQHNRHGFLQEKEPKTSINDSITLKSTFFASLYSFRNLPGKCATVLPSPRSRNLPGGMFLSWRGSAAPSEAWTTTSGNVLRPRKPRCSPVRTLGKSAPAAAKRLQPSGVPTRRRREDETTTIVSTTKVRIFEQSFYLWLWSMKFGRSTSSEITLSTDFVTIWSPDFLFKSAVHWSGIESTEIMVL